MMSDDNEIESTSNHHHQQQHPTLTPDTNEDDTHAQKPNNDNNSCLIVPPATNINATQDDRQSNQEDTLLPYNSSNEETPLLSNNSIISKRSQLITSSSHCYYIIIILSILLTGLLWGSIIYNIVHNIESSINDSIQFNLDQVSIQLITPQGINIHILGSININYDDIINLIQRNSIKFLTGIFGSLTIINLQPIEIYSKFIDLKENKDISFIHLVDSYIPSSSPINIKIGHLQTTNIDIISPCQFVNNDNDNDDDNFMKFLNDYYKLNNNDDKINLKIKGLVKQIRIKSWLFKHDLENIEFYKHVTIYKHDIIPNVNIDKFNLYSSIDNKGNDIINIKINALVDIPEIILSSIKDLKFQFGLINWNLFFNDCDEEKNLIKVGDWESYPFQIDNRHQSISLIVIGNISSIPDELMNECTQDEDGGGGGKSPLNKILQKYLDNEPIEFYLQLLDNNNNDNNDDDNQDEDELPDWLFDFLHDTPIKLAITLPKMNIDKYKLHHEKFEIINHSSQVSIENNNQSLVSHWNSNISLNLDNQFKEIDLDINKFKFDFEIFSGRGGILKITSNDEYIYITMMNQNQELINVVMNLPNLDISIIDVNQMGKIINKVLNRNHKEEEEEEEEEEDLFIEGNLYDVYGKLPIWKNNNGKLIDHLFIPLMKLPKLSTTIENSSIYSSNSLSNLTITITNIYLIKLTTKKLELLIDLIIYNPTNFTISNFDSSLLIDPIILEIFKHDSLISSIEVIPNTQSGNLIIPSKDYFNTTIDLNIYSLNYRDKSILENSISSFTSNDNLSNITITPTTTITTTPITTTNFNPLIDLLSSIELTNITINSQILSNGMINFLHDQELINNIQIHLFTSQIQFNIYNPIINSSIILFIYTGLAKTNSNDNVIELGHLLHQEQIIIPANGIYQTSKLPIKINPMGMEILKKYLHEQPDQNGGLMNVEINTVFNVKIDQFDVELYYNGNVDVDVKLAM